MAVVVQIVADSLHMLIMLSAHSSKSAARNRYACCGSRACQARQPGGMAGAMYIVEVLEGDALALHTANMVDKQRMGRAHEAACSGHREDLLECLEELVHVERQVGIHQELCGHLDCSLGCGGHPQAYMLTAGRQAADLVAASLNTMMFIAPLASMAARATTYLVLLVCCSSCILEAAAAAFSVPCS